MKLRTFILKIKLYTMNAYFIKNKITLRLIILFSSILLKLYLNEFVLITYL